MSFEHFDYIGLFSWQKVIIPYNSESYAGKIKRSVPGGHGNAGNLSVDGKRAREVRCRTVQSRTNFRSLVVAERTLSLSVAELTGFQTDGHIRRDGGLALVRRTGKLTGWTDLLDHCGIQFKICMDILILMGYNE